MKSTLVILLFGLFAFCLCETSPSEGGFGDAFTAVEEGIVKKLEDQLNQDTTLEDDGEEDDEYGLYNDDDEDEKYEEEKTDDDEDKDKEDDTNPKAEAAGRKKREALKVATRFVRDAAQYQANIVSEMHKAFDALKRR